MLDITMFREHADLIRADHTKRGLAHDNIDKVIELDQNWRNLLHETDQLRREKNEAARGIGAAKKSGDQEEANRILAEVADLGQRITDLEAKTNEAMTARDRLRMSIPNILHEDVPIGDDDAGNTVHAVHGTKPTFSFEPRTHNELIEMNRWVDLALLKLRSRFYFLKGDLARLEFALQQYAVEFLRARSYTFVQPPVMMNREAYEGVTDLGDFETVMYGVEPDKYYMIATSEHPLLAMYMDETIPEDQLPLRMVGVSQCFRREVGSHGQSDLGIWRVHQFTKVEQIILARPEDSWSLHEELLKNCTDLWDSLGIHYEVVNICTGDMGTVAAKNTISRLGFLVPINTKRSFRVPIAPITKPIDWAFATASRAIQTNPSFTRSIPPPWPPQGRLSPLWNKANSRTARAVPDVLQPFMGGQSILEPCGWG